MEQSHGDMDTTMDKVLHHIYSACDPDNTDLVPASTLLEFVKPYMGENLSELESLKLYLEPSESDQGGVSYAKFAEAMALWSEKIKNDDNFAPAVDVIDNLPQIEEREDNNTPPCGMSTPRQSVGYCQLIKNYSEILNASIGSIYTSEITINHDKSQYEEQIKELQYLAQKTTHELDLIKQQLAFAEEQNEVLVNDLKHTQKLLQAEQMIVKQLKDVKNDNDELKEEIKVIKAKNYELKRMFNAAEKAQQNLLVQISNLESEKNVAETKLEAQLKKERDLKSSISDLKIALDTKESDMSSLMGIINELKSQLNEKDELVNFYSNENSRIKSETFNLDKIYADLHSTRSDSILNYNSPKLLHQISNPISPIFNTGGDNVPLIRKVLTQQQNACFYGEACLNSESPPVLYVVDRSPDSPLNKNKSLKDELSETSWRSSDEISRLKEELNSQEDIKNILWKETKNYEKSIREKDDLIDDLKERLDQLLLDVEKEQSLNVELRRELEDITQKYRQIVRKINVISDEKSTQTITDPDFESLLKEHDKLKLKYMEEKNQNAFMAGVKESLEKLWKDNELVITKSCEIISAIYDKIEPKLRAQTLLNFNSKNSGTIIDQLNNISTMIDALIKIKSETSFDIESPRNLNHGKQQLKIEKMSEKLENCAKEIAFERNLKMQIIEENQALKSELISLRSMLQRDKDMNVKRSSEIDNLKQTLRDYEEDNRTLRIEKETLLKDYAKISDELKAKCDEKFAQITQQQNLEAELHKTITRELQAKNEINALKQANIIASYEYQNSLSDKDNVLQQLRHFINNKSQEIDTCFGVIIETLRTRDFDNINDNHHQNQLISDLDMRNLDCKLKSMLNLLQSLTERYVDIFDVKRNQEEQIRMIESNNSENLVSPSGCDVSFDFDEDSFSTCANNYSLVLIDNGDSFLNDIDLQDFTTDARNLTKRQLEEKFTTLALNFAVDSKTSKEHYDELKFKLEQLMHKHFRYLEYSVDLIMKLKCESNTLRLAISHLQHLKETSRDVFEAAQHFGVAQYEYRMISCWNLVTNYVAVLSRQDKDIITAKENNDYFQKENNRSRNFYCFSVSFFVLLLLFASVIVLIYMVWEYPQFNRTRVCPLKWISDCLIKKISLKQPPY